MIGPIRKNRRPVPGSDLQIGGESIVAGSAKSPVAGLGKINITRPVDGEVILINLVAFGRSVSPVKVNL